MLRPVAIGDSDEVSQKVLAYLQFRHVSYTATTAAAAVVGTRESSSLLRMLVQVLATLPLSKQLVLKQQSRLLVSCPFLHHTKVFV